MATTKWHVRECFLNQELFLHRRDLASGDISLLVTAVLEEIKAPDSSRALADTQDSVGVPMIMQLDDRIGTHSNLIHKNWWNKSLKIGLIVTVAAWHESISLELGDFRQLGNGHLDVLLLIRALAGDQSPRLRSQIRNQSLQFDGFRFRR